MSARLPLEEASSASESRTNGVEQALYLNEQVKLVILGDETRMHRANSIVLVGAGDRDVIPITAGENLSFLELA